jgi:hypothetical protein
VSNGPRCAACGPSGLPTRRRAGLLAHRLRSLRAYGLRLAALVRGLAGELSDESAYARHLKAHGRVHSPEEWRRFSDVRLKAKFGQAKCC